MPSSRLAVACTASPTSAIAPAMMPAKSGALRTASDGAGASRTRHGPSGMGTETSSSPVGIHVNESAGSVVAWTRSGSQTWLPTAHTGVS
ncbi:MAG: hypothetical protein U0270_08970 [Labilithrix sp.]